MRHVLLLRFVVVAVVGVAGSSSCTRMAGPCATSDALVFEGEFRPMSGPVVVDVDDVDDIDVESGGRVTIAWGPVDEPGVNSVTFARGDVPFAAPVGEVTVQTGDAFAGEGSELAYVRFTDAVGVWFEGGSSPTIDDLQGGGHQIDGIFDVGAPLDAPFGAHCAMGGTTRALHAVTVAFDDGVVDVGIEGRDGVVQGVPVHARGVDAARWTRVEPPGVVDANVGPGWHDASDVRGYAFRTP
jgi:hypothetical protein